MFKEFNKKMNNAKFSISNDYMLIHLELRKRSYEITNYETGNK